MKLHAPIIRTNRRAPSGPRFGVRAHDFGRKPADELAARIAAQGFSCVQLALNKAIAGLNLQAGEMTAEDARDIGGAFLHHRVNIEVLGCYINPLHPHVKTRADSLRFFKDHLQLARNFGCGIVALESGSAREDYSPHPANQSEAAFDELLGVIHDLVVVAEACGVWVGLEAVYGHTVSTAHKMRRLLDSIRSKHLRVVFDAANLLSPENVHHQSAIIAEALELLGDDIAVIHANDFTFENDLPVAVSWIGRRF